MAKKKINTKVSVVTKDEADMIYCALIVFRSQMYVLIENYPEHKYYKLELIKCNKLIKKMKAI